MNEKAIKHVQRTIMHSWSRVMDYERELKMPELNAEDIQMINGIIEGIKEEIGIYEHILIKLEQ